MSFVVPSRSVSISLSVVYAKCYKVQRRALWSELEILDRSTQGAWAIVVDFNAVASPEERRGSWGVDRSSIQEFAEMIHNSGLIDAGFVGNRFTWCSNDKEMLVFGLGWTKCFLTPLGCPSSNCFVSNTFLLIQKAWSGNCSPHSMINVQLKLKKTKQLLKMWNKETFGNIFQQIKIAEEELEGIDSHLQSSPSEELSRQYIKAQKKLHHLKIMEEAF
ncbi:uncharacterized protein LOC131232388 [Magnolia sinica]|uniref:uncharacterized protein LOC131232388 n=1 Tax=Magnolia sinica TaxID=86752 RepID=UPI00265A8FC2|nr:uncharacterized protein LOC131232388 [Magnolia sinica]